jgi:ABC-2 type transport system ATP-binding protein
VTDLRADQGTALDSTDQHAVDVVELVKRYPKGTVNAVDGLSFSVRAGEVFGLLGPNGAGKTTTVGILTTRLHATSGRVRLAGIDVLADPVAARARLAVVPQRSNLDRALTPRQNLTYHAAYHGVGRAERNERAQELLDEFGLTEAADTKVDFYSGGMAQRLMIARSLIHEPQVLFLDEPTTGLDPQARLFVWDRVRELRRRAVTILLTTHDMDEAAELCDRVGIVDHGRLLALDTPKALVRGLSGHAVLDLTVEPGPSDDPAALLAALVALPVVERGEQVDAQLPSDGGGRVRLYLAGDASAGLTTVIELLSSRRAALSDVHIGEPDLEDVFIHHTGRGLR